MILDLINQHYIDNHQRLIKKMSFRAGTIWSAEDVVHTAYERAIRYRRNCREGMFGQWFSMLLNNALRDFKDLERGYIPLDTEIEETEGSPCPSYPENIMREIFELIDTKSEVQIEVLTLYFKQDYSAKDIAAITKHSYAKTHQIISRFRSELKELYKE